MDFYLIISVSLKVAVAGIYRGTEALFLNNRLGNWVKAVKEYKDEYLFQSKPKSSSKLITNPISPETSTNENPMKAYRNNSSRCDGFLPMDISNEP